VEVVVMVVEHLVEVVRSHSWCSMLTVRSHSWCSMLTVVVVMVVGSVVVGSVVAGSAVVGSVVVGSVVVVAAPLHTPVVVGSVVVVVAVMVFQEELVVMEYDTTHLAGHSGISSHPLVRTPQATPMPQKTY